MIQRHSSHQFSGRSNTQRRCKHHGLTLIEVLLATSILVMAMSALTYLQDSGVRAATRAELECEAVVICQSEMDRLLSQSTQLKENDQIVATAPDWTRRVRVNPTSVQGLLCLTVELFRTSSVQDFRTRPAASLSRWIPSRDASGQSQTTGGNP